jgi:tetratricopeptide (TPR) repeat protein
MKKILILFAATLIACLPLFAQKKKGERKLSDEEAKTVMDQLFKDTTAFVNDFGQKACTCIDSVNKIVTEKNKKLEAFSACIDEQVTSFQLMDKLMGSMLSNKKENSIDLSTNKNSDEYKRYYFMLERWLKDSCRVLNNALASNDEKKEHSVSEDPDARAAYTSGVQFLKTDNYAEAIPWFEKAVAIDSVFAFAWDNLGICYRKTNQLDKAVAAYQASLRIDPSGMTPLQNLPVVYMLQDKVDEALAGYDKLLVYDPENAEVYYGKAIVYINKKKDTENGLRNLCQAYNLYIKQKSPYRSDAEKVINQLHEQMVKENKEATFDQILKEYNIRYK